MTRLDAHRIRQLNRQADALLRKTPAHKRYHQQSQFMIGYVPPLQHLAPRTKKPSGRYLLVVLAVIVSVVCFNVTKPDSDRTTTTIAGK